MSTLTSAPSSLPPAFLARVEHAYLRPPRAYHNWSHIQAVLGDVARVAAGPGWRQPTEVTLAALFHDAVYVAGRKDNEVKSAELARASIEAELPTRGIDCHRVMQLIELTARHGSHSVALDSDAKLFLDCDLAILGAPATDFDAYHRAIADEFAPHVNALLYRLGRRRFLTRLLEAPRIFLSDFFHERLDSAARENLRRALR